MKEIEKHGNFAGACGSHTQLCINLMRALGIAPQIFRVVASRADLGDHAWPARFDPSCNLWLAFQSGRHDENWWYFFIDRRNVFSYAVEAGEFPMGKSYKGPRPFPLVFCRELQGFKVKALSQGGIPTKEVREWMLTPCF